MRAVVQRCGYASVNVNGKIVGEIGKGVMVLVGFAPDDTEKDIDYIIDKTVNLRITPELIFELDDSMEYGAKIDNILKEIKGEQ